MTVHIIIYFSLLNNRAQYGAFKCLLLIAIVGASAGDNVDFRQQFLEQRNKKNMEEAEDVDVNAAIHGKSNIRLRMTSLVYGCEQSCSIEIIVSSYILLDQLRSSCKAWSSKKCKDDFFLILFFTKKKTCTHIDKKRSTFLCDSQKKNTYNKYV